MAPVELSKKGAAHHGWVRQRDLDGLEMHILQASIAMLKKKHIAVAGSGPEIHLLAAIRGGAGDERRARSERDPFRFFVAGRIHYDRFHDAFLRNQTGQERLEIVRVPPGWNDYANSQTRVRNVTKPIHYGFFSRQARARSRARRSDAVRLLVPC